MMNKTRGNERKTKKEMKKDDKVALLFWGVVYKEWGINEKNIERWNFVEFKIVFINFKL